MKNLAEEQPQAPPGVIAALTAGFEVTTSHIWLILLPFALDLIYWLGPRIAVERLFNETLKPLLEEPAAQEAANQLMEMASGVNVLTTLSVPLIGIPALMGGVAPEQTPISAEVYQIDSMSGVVLLLAGLSLLGLFISTVYLSLIALALQDQQQRPAGSRAFFAALLKSVVRLFILGVVFIAVLVIVWLPLLPVAFLVGLLAVDLAVYVMLAGFVLVVIYFSMSVPGIVFNGRTILQAILESVRLVHRNAMQTTLLLLAIVLVSSGTNRLWHLADDGSWLTIISIAGHAFISTALAAAFFVFYRDRWTYVLERSSEE
jgi:hypothetical protein